MTSVLGRRLASYPQAGGTGYVFLAPGETLLLDSVAYSDLKPPGISPEAALRELGALSDGAPLAELGSRGPLRASVAGAANAGNASVGAFPNRFCRDSELAAWFLPGRYQQLQVATTRFWLERVGLENNPETHEEPWRVPARHRTADDPSLPMRPGTDDRPVAFSSLDASPLTVRSALRQMAREPGLAAERLTHYTGDRTYTYATAVAGVLGRMTAWREANAEGLVEAEAYAGVYKSFPYWKDSPTAYCHSDGTLASPPVSTVEMVSYLYQCFDGASQLASARPELGWDAREFAAQRDSTRAGLLKHYWLDDMQHFALGTDRGPAGEVRALRPKASNMGHLLEGGLLEGEEMRPFREAVVRRLISPEMLVPAGVLTLGNDEVLFSPNRYHNGASWPHDTFVFARGLARHYPALALLLCDAVERALSTYYVEHLPGTGDPRPEPCRWNVRVERANVYGDVIRPTVERSPDVIMAWGVASLLGARELRRQLLTTGRTQARGAERALERQLEPLARALLALPTPDTASAAPRRTAQRDVRRRL